MKKQIIALVLALAMVFSCMNLAIVAADFDADDAFNTTQGRN